MKTAEQKALDVVTEWVKQTGAISTGASFFEKLCKSVEIAIKEQDRDTRHACAEAVLACKSGSLPDGGCWKNDAHDACMNVRAV
jgi:hypothetical protein